MLYNIYLSLTILLGYPQLVPDPAAQCSHYRAVLYKSGAPVEVAEYLPGGFDGIAAGDYTVDVRCVDQYGRNAGPVVVIPLKVPQDTASYPADNGEKLLAVAYTTRVTPPPVVNTDPPNVPPPDAPVDPTAPASTL